MAEDVLGPSTILSPEMAGWHFHWHLLPNFMANFLQKLDGTGKLQWSSHGTEERARRHVWEVAQLLPDADRTVLPANVCRTPRDALATGTYYDLLTAAKVAGGAAPPIVFFVRSLFAGGFTLAEHADGNSDFQQQIAHVLTCSKSQSTALVGQAADVCIFIRRVYPKGLLWPFVPIEEMYAEARTTHASTEQTHREGNVGTSLDGAVQQSADKTLVLTQKNIGRRLRVLARQQSFGNVDS